MAFNIFTAKRVSCFGQYDRIDDFTTGKLRGDKRPVDGPPAYWLGVGYFRAF
jgi:hypothetical protein